MNRQEKNNRIKIESGNQTDKQSKSHRGRQAAAWIAIIVLLLLYLSTLAAAFLHTAGWDRLFRACLAATVGVPVLLWIYIWLYQKISRQTGQPKEEQDHEELEP